MPQGAMGQAIEVLEEELEAFLRQSGTFEKRSSGLERLLDAARRVVRLHHDLKEAGR